MSIFESMDYIDILETLISSDSKSGVKRRLAVFMGCQPAYLSRVLARTADLNTDQLLRAATFFNLSASEKEVWIDILQENRAGDESTKKFFRARAEKALVNVRQLENRLRTTNKLNSADEAKYYDSWIYSAVHMACRIPEFQDVEKLSSLFATTPLQMNEILSTLSGMGLIEFEVGKIASQVSSLHVGENSPWVSRHHMNWRHKTAEKLSRGDKDGLHYTSTISCSEEDLLRIKEFFVETIQKTRKAVGKSADEVVAHYSLDLYRL